MRGVKREEIDTVRVWSERGVDIVRKVCGMNENEIDIVREV